MNAKNESAPAFAIVSPYRAFNWLLRWVLPRIRNRYGVNFIFLIDEGSDLPTELVEITSSDDQILYVPNFLKYCNSNHFQNFESTVARKRETQYSVHYLRDILQQERDFAGIFLVGAQSHIYDKVSKITDDQIYGTINYYFDFAENIFKGRDIKFAIVWPRTAFESVVCHVSKKFDAIVTFPYVSKGEGNLIYWADGAFASGELHRSLYDNINADVSISISSIAPPTDRASVKRSDAKRIYSITGSAWQIYVITRDRIALFCLDLIRRRRSRRVSYFELLGNVVRKFLFHRKFSKLAQSVPEERCDYALFTFQNEPEFAVQGRCKEFNDQMFIIRSIALNLPAGITLFVKEHAWIGNRDLSAYEQILRLPNVKMLPFYRNAADFLERAKFVASLNGSILFEAAMRGVPGIAFSPRSEFLCLRSVFAPQNITEMRFFVGKLCEERSAEEITDWKMSAKKYLSLVREISFDGTPLFTHPTNKVAKEDIEKAFQNFCGYYGLRKKNN